MTNGGSGESRLNKNQLRDAAREKAKVLREQQKKKDRRGRFLLQGGLILVSLAIVATVTLIIVNSIKPPVPGPLNMLSDGITIGAGNVAEKTRALPAGDEPVESADDPESDAIAIQVWLDYQCPVCGAFDDANSELIATLLEQGAATLEIHPVAILDRASVGERFSSRAANAAACVANYSPNSFLDFNSLLFENQPDEQTSGLTDDELIALTEEAGVSKASSIERCISDERFKDWVSDATSRAVSDPDLLNEAGQFGTPTVFVDGNRYAGALNNPTAFAQFVAAADGAAFSEESSPSPSPSPSQ